MSSITSNIAAITGSTSATGTICAEPTGAWANLRSRAVLPLIALALVAMLTGASAPPTHAELQISIDGVRNAKGAVMLCLTRMTEQSFLACGQDPARITRVVAADEAGRIVIADLPPGEYSLLAIHDENRNGKLDKSFGIPREGFGFSRNPAIRMGPPHYADVHFAVPPGHSAQAIKLKYLL